MRPDETKSGTARQCNTTHATAYAGCEAPSVLPKLAMNRPCPPSESGATASVQNLAHSLAVASDGDYTATARYVQLSGLHVCDVNPHRDNPLRSVDPGKHAPARRTRPSDRSRRPAGASRITAARALSAVRRGSKSPGKWLPLRSIEIFRWMLPARVS